MKKFLILVVLFIFASLPLWAVDFTGDFDYEVTFDKEAMQGNPDFGTLDIEVSAEIDEHNTLTVAVETDDESDLSISEAYLTTVYDPFTVELGDIGFDSYDYAVTDNGLELLDGGIEVKGITGAVDYKGFAFKAGVGLEPNPEWGVTAGYSIEWLEKFELGFFKGKIGTVSMQAILNRFTISGGVRLEASGQTLGGGVKVDLDPAWIAAGANSRGEFAGDVGIDKGTYGAMVSAQYVDKANFEEASAWVKPGGVKYKAGYRFIDKEAFVNVSAEL